MTKITGRGSRIVATAAFAILGVSTSAVAQRAPFGEIAGSYQVQADVAAPAESRVLSGWNMAGALNQSDRLALVFEWGLSKTSYTYTRRDEIRRFEEPDKYLYVRTDTPVVRRDLTRSFRGGGLRYRWRGAQRARPFAQVLLGVAVGDWEEFPPRPRQEYIIHHTPEGSFWEPNDRPERDHSEKLLAVWPGIGVDIKVADRVTVRFQADLLLALLVEHGGVLGPRLMGGMVFGFGSR
jgi:hypothetical protein